MGRERGCELECETHGFRGLGGVGGGIDKEKEGGGRGAISAVLFLGGRREKHYKITEVAVKKAYNKPGSRRELAPFRPCLESPRPCAPSPVQRLRAAFGARAKRSSARARARAAPGPGRQTDTLALLIPIKAGFLPRGFPLRARVKCAV